MSRTETYSLAENKTILIWAQDINHVQLLNVKSTADCWDTVSDK